jgi:hypothetical protein
MAPWHVGLELRNVDANYRFERSHRFARIQPNSGFGDYSRLSCGVGDTVSTRGATCAARRPAPSVLEESDTATIVFERKHLPKLEAAVRFLKKCRAWVWDRHRGKALYLTPEEMKELE